MKTSSRFGDVNLGHVYIVRVEILSFRRKSFVSQSFQAKLAIELEASYWVGAQYALT